MQFADINRYGARVFSTTLGHPRDFAVSQIMRLVVNGLAGGGHQYFRGIRSGCTNNVIPAGGILSAPNAMRHCTCNHAVATSRALVNMPEASNWETSHWTN